MEFGNPTIKILYTTPEQISTEKFFKILNILNSKKNLSFFVIDEAHCISTWGHDFRPNYLKLSKLKKNFPFIPTMALTATATENVRKDILAVLKSPKMLLSSFNRPEIFYVVKSAHNRMDDLKNFLKDHSSESGVIYCRTKNMVDELETKLSEFKVKGYHADKKNEEKTKILMDWQEGNVKIIIATIAFGMGIDKKDVRFVVHYNMSDSLEK